MSPGAIESCISRDPKLAALQPQVVGAPDSIAGELPIVVVNAKVDQSTRDAIREAVLNNMGIIYVPDDIISLQDLGVEQYPTTMAGKVKKTELRALVNKYREDEHTGNGSAPNPQFAASIKSIWAKALGLPVQRLSTSAPITDLADSITVLRVRDTIKRQLGRSLSAVDMAKIVTVADQISLLQRQEPEPPQSNGIKAPTRAGPPTLHDIPHLLDDEDLLKDTQKAALDTISPHGFDWNDVEEVIPVYDFGSMMLENGIFDSWGFQFAIPTKHKERQVCYSPILRTAER